MERGDVGYVLGLVFWFESVGCRVSWHSGVADSIITATVIRYVLVLCMAFVTLYLGNLIYNPNPFCVLCYSGDSYAAQLL